MARGAISARQRDNYRLPMSTFSRRRTARHRSKRRFRADSGFRSVENECSLLRGQSAKQRTSPLPGAGDDRVVGSFEACLGDAS